MRWSSSILLIGPAILAGATLLPPAAPAPDYKRDILPILTKYCGPCHGARDGVSDMSLAVLQTADSFKNQREMWERIEENLSNGQMPPSGQPAPGDSDRAKVISFIKKALGPPAPNPGRVTMRRLNREEYNNTIRDLFGVDLRPGDDFPSDDVGYGFDNIGDVLSMSPLLMDKYLKAAQSVAETVIYTPGVRTWRIQGADLDGANSSPLEDGSTVLYSEGVVSREFQLPAEGDYKVSVSVAQDKAGPEDARMSLTMNGKVLETAVVRPLRTHPIVVEREIHAGPGRTTFGAGFLNDYYKPRTKTSPQEDRNLYVNYIEVKGPIGPVTKAPSSQSKIIFVQPTPATRADCERRIVAAFAAKAYRRPPTSSEVDRLVSIAEVAHKNGDSFERGIQLAVTAALCSPNFLFRVEHPTSESLGPYEIATRLSYFLWSSMPDDELFTLAAKRLLKDPAILKQQVARMLKDPKAGALADNFAGQWLQTRKLRVVQPDRALFPQYTEEVRGSMATETKMFFQDVVQNDRSVLDFLAGRFSFVNGPLAQIYGIPNVSGNAFVRVSLPPERAGILTQGSVLVVTSNPTRTSPVKRGKWILENILGTPPAPPPPGVGVLKDDHASVEAATLKERMEQHRKDPMCASCHKTMDGLGFALENFDAVGAWRTKDGRFDIEPSGTLPDGSKFAGPAELRGILMKRKDQFVRCLSQKMLTYALGRGLESFDDPAVDKIVQTVSKGEYKFSALVGAVVMSEPFRKSRAEK